MTERTREDILGIDQVQQEFISQMFGEGGLLKSIMPLLKGGVDKMTKMMVENNIFLAIKVLEDGGNKEVVVIIFKTNSEFKIDNNNFEVDEDMVIATLKLNDLLELLLSGKFESLLKK